MNTASTPSDRPDPQAANRPMRRFFYGCSPPCRHPPRKKPATTQQVHDHRRAPAAHRPHRHHAPINHSKHRTSALASRLWSGEVQRMKPPPPASPEPQSPTARRQSQSKSCVKIFKTHINFNKQRSLFDIYQQNSAKFTLNGTIPRKPDCSQRWRCA